MLANFHGRTFHAEVRVHRLEKQEEYSPGGRYRCRHRRAGGELSIFSRRME
jgi:hypothetical protein